MNEPDDGGKETGDEQEAAREGTNGETLELELCIEARLNETGDELGAESEINEGVAASEPVDNGEPELTTATGEWS